MPEQDPKEQITIACRGVLRRARAKRSALATFGRSGWYEVAAPATGKESRRRRTSAAKAAETESASDPTTSSPVPGEDKE